MIRFGVIGAGRIAQTFSDAVKGVNDAELYAVASRDLEKAQAFKSQHQYKHAYGSYEAMLEDSNVDCVYIATPHGLHYEQMLKCLEYNKPILCEKAFTLNATQAKHVFDIARKKNLFVMEAMWTRFLPVIQAVKEIIADGVIGEIKHLDITFGFHTEAEDRDRIFNPSLGGGALLDIGIYPLTLADMLLGAPEKVETTVKKHPRTGVDIHETMTLSYKNASAQITAAFDENLPNDAKIIGSKGTIVIPFFWQAEEAYIYDDKQNLCEKLSFPHPVNGFEYEIEAVVYCLKNNFKESPIMPHTKTIAMLNQMDALRKAWLINYPNEL